MKAAAAAEMLGRPCSVAPRHLPHTNCRRPNYCSVPSRLSSRNFNDGAGVARRSLPCPWLPNPRPSSATLWHLNAQHCCNGKSFSLISLRLFSTTLLENCCRWSGDGSSSSSCSSGCRQVIQNYDRSNENKYTVWRSSSCRLSNKNVCGCRRKYHESGRSEEKLSNRPTARNSPDQKNQLNHQHLQRRETNHNQYNHRPRQHSTRLVSESAARRTTQLYLDYHDNNTRSNLPPLPPWKDSVSLFGAELALEYWANRNNTNSHKNNNDHLMNQSTVQLEEDAATAHRLFSVLEHIHLCIDDGRGTDFILTNAMYSHVIDALAKSPKFEHVELAESYLRKFMELYLLRNIQYSLVCQPSVMQLLDQIRGASHHLTTSMDEDGECRFTNQTKIAPIRWNNTDKHHFPNQIRITGVMRGYARQSNPKAAEALLILMRDLSSCPTLNRQQCMQIFRPNAVGYATVIDAYSRMHDGMNAERILHLMSSASNVVAYNATISAWARCTKAPNVHVRTTISSKSAPNEAAISSSRRAAKNAERLLREMWNAGLGDSNKNDEESHNKSPNGNPLLPDVVTYSTVISAYATCLDQPYGLTRAHALLTELEGLATQEFEETQSATMHEGRNLSTSMYGRGRNPHGFQPNASVYNTILQAYANAGDSISAEAILESMISLHTSSLKDGGGGPFQHVRPNTRTFNVVLNAVAKGDGIDAGTRARKILVRLESMMESKSGNDGLRPDIITYNSVLSAWSKSASIAPNNSKSKSEVEDAEIRLVGKYAAYEALKLLDQIEEQYMKSFDRKHTNNRSHVVKPDVITYNTTISALANAAKHGDDGITIAEKAEDALNRMVTIGIQPDSYSYNGVLLAWSRLSGGMMAAEHAESILRSMKEPTIISWSTVVNAYAHADGAHKAEALLREMEDNVTVASSLSSPDRSNQGTRASPIVPSTVLYNNVLLSWGRSSDVNASRNAELLFNRMHDLPHLPSPDAISYRLVLTAMEHTLDGDKAERAKSILNRLLASKEARTLYITPQDILNAFNSVLTACAYTPSEAGEHHRNNAARILVETLRDLNNFPWPEDSEGGGSSCGPNQETYAHFIKGCIHLFDPSSDERNALLELALRECCNRGLLSRSIWDKFCIAIGPRAAREFLGEAISEFDEFPKEWCKKGP